MTHQPDPVIDAVQDRHVEKIILSGSPFVSSILGPGAYRIIAPSVPLFYTNPVISGSLAPPSTLLCDEGSFNSSPRATVTYQWKRGGVDIPDETSNTWNSVLGDIGDTITCEVTITNDSGNDIALSNAVVMEAILPGYVYEYDVMTIVGMGNPERIDINDLDAFIISGMGHEAQLSIFSEDVIVITGVAVSARMDMIEADTYVMFVPTPMTPLVVLNGDAENSDMSDWTMDFGGVTSVTTAAGAKTGYREGLRFFKPDDLGQEVDSQMSQVIEIPAGDLTDIDTGRCYAIVNFIHNSNAGYDNLEITLEALNAALSVIGTITQVYDSNPSLDDWRRENTQDNILSIPTLTRHIKVTILFDNNSGGLATSGAYVDDIQIELMKIE